MMPYIPDEVLYMVCTQLRHLQDTGTLFNCACSGRRLAEKALENLYRTQAVSPSDAWNRTCIVNNHGRFLKPEEIFVKCAQLWRTIILSSQGRTMYPYSYYLRTLNLEHLGELLVECNSNRELLRQVFPGDLAHFAVFYPHATSHNELGERVEIPAHLDILNTIRRIGHVITKHMPLVQELLGYELCCTLSSWLPNFPRLEYLKHWRGASVLAANATLIRTHCRSFKRLEFMNRRSVTADEDISAFLLELRPQSLESFEMKNYHHFGALLFSALSCHGKALTNLKLNTLSLDAIAEISRLKECTNLVSLSLTGDWRVDPRFGVSHGDVLSEAVAWLRQCKSLRNISFCNLFIGPALIEPVLMDNSVPLTSLHYRGFARPDIGILYPALAHKTSLQSLWLERALDEDILPYSMYRDHNESWLNGDANEDLPEDRVLVDSLSKLVNLTSLHTFWVANSFNDQHIMQLARNLQKLQIWFTGGHYLTDAIWGEVASLRSLKNLEIGGLTFFTAEGILEFIKQLGPGNKGLDLSVRSMTKLPWYKRGEIHKRIVEKVQGRFDLTPITESGDSVYGDEIDGSLTL